MVSIDKIKMILWDFDGVILDSMSVRDDGFREVLKEYPNDLVDRLIKYHRENGGLSRYVKFRYFFEEILNKDISEDQVNDLANSFSAIMIKRLVSPENLIQDSLNFVKDNCETILMHIVSGSDHDELNFLCKAFGIDGYFNSINGSPTPKNILVKNIVDKSNFIKTEIVLIGDSINDYDAAVDNGILFFAYNNPELKDDHIYIRSFTEIQ